MFWSQRSVARHYLACFLTVGSGVPAAEAGADAAGPAAAQGPAPGLAAEEVESA